MQNAAPLPLELDRGASGQLPAAAAFGERRAGPEQVLWSSLALVLVLAWTAIVVGCLQLASIREREQASVALSTAKGIAEYTGLHLMLVDHAMLDARKHYLATGRVLPHEQIVEDIGVPGAVLQQLFATDAQGTLVASSMPFTRGASVAERPLFRTFRADPRERLHMDLPVGGREPGGMPMAVQVARPLLGANGEFRGVIVASIDPRELQQYFKSLGVFEDGGTVAIAGRSDGVVRARFTQTEISWGQSLRSNRFWARVSAEPSGSFRTESAIDGMTRLIAFHKVPAQQLFVAVTRPTTLVSGREVWLAFFAGVALTAALVTDVLARVRRVRDRQALVAELSQSRAREAIANHMRGRFIASISHELRTPLNAILGVSELLRDMRDEHDKVKYASLIRESGMHLQSLLDKLLDLARIEAGRMDVQRSEFDLLETVETVMQVHRKGAVRKGLSIKLESALPAGRKAIANTDRTKYVQVLNNALSNAVKFTAQGGVAVSAAMHEGEFVLRISDTGCGIAADRLPHVFDRFSSPDEAGAGFGLSLAHELMGLLGGSIELSSAPGQGTEVVIRLPHVRLAEPA